MLLDNLHPELTFLFSFFYPRFFHPPIKALSAYGYFLLFDLFGLISQMISLILKWKLISPSKLYSYGIDRFEIVFSFSVSLSLLFSGLYVIKESLEHLLQA